MTRSRDALVAAAVRIVEERGLSGATTRLIAEHAGVNEVTLFRQFGSKTELLKAALEEEANVLENATTPSGQLEADLLRVVSEFAAVARRRGRLLAVAYAEVPRWPEFESVMARQTRALMGVAELLAHYQRQRAMRTEPPIAAAMALLGPLVFTALVEVSAPGQLPPFDPSTYVHAFLDGRRSTLQAPSPARGNSSRRAPATRRR
jgi:AcrR family transcriptional regulator